MMFYGIKDLIRQFCTDEEVEIFAEWAFGDDFKLIVGSIRFLNAWNELHGSKLFLHDDGSPQEDMEKMIALWRESIDTKE